MSKKRQATSGKRQVIMKTRFVVRASFLFLWCTALLLLNGCTDSPSAFTLKGNTMGTTYHITVVDSGVSSNSQAVNIEKLQQAVDDELHKINQLMSTYIADSELSRFNQLEENTWFTLSPETFFVIEYSLSLSKLSNGKFDVTVSPLIDLWGFGSQGVTDFPDDSAIALAKQQVGWHSIVIDKDNLRIKKNKSLTINLSAVAKGYGVDHIAQLLDSYQLDNYLVEIGGEIRAKGKNKEGVFWKIGIETPSFLHTNVQKIIVIDNKAVATSGDYRNFFEKEGVRYSHTIDPHTGKPVSHNIASLTVIHHSAMEADALATAMMVMGEDKALAMANLYNIPVYMLLYGQNNDYTATYSNSFATYLD